MKAINFVLQSTSNNSVIVQEDLLPKFYNYLHYHKEYQITLILKGEGNVIVGNYNQLFKAGDIYFIGPNLKFSVSGMLCLTKPVDNDLNSLIFFSQY